VLDRPLERFRRLASLNREIFYALREAQVVIAQWRHHYHHPTAQRTELPAARTGSDPDPQTSTQPAARRAN